MQLCHFYTKVVVDNGAYTLTSRGYGSSIASIEFTSDFSNQSDPSDTNITIHGLSVASAAKFYNGASIDLYAGYWNMDYTENNIGFVMGGKLSQLQPRYNSGGDWILAFTVTDGTNYNNIATIKAAVAKNVRAKASLKRNPKLTKAKQLELATITQQYQSIRQKGNHTRAQLKALATQEASRKKSVNTKFKAEANRQAKVAAKTDSKKNKIVYKALHFKKGTTGKAIITTLAGKAGIKIATMKLVKNKTYKNGYTASKKPMDCIKQVANDCNTDVFWKNGKLQIKGYANQKKIKYEATVETGIISPPQLQTDDSTDTTQSTTTNAKKKKKQSKQQAVKPNAKAVNTNMLKNGIYQMTLIFNHEITTGVIFDVKDKISGFTGEIIVNSGEHSFSPGSTPTTQVTFELLSKYKSDQKKKAAQEASAEKRKELAKEKKQRNTAKAKRASRTSAKLGGGASGTKSSTRLLHAAAKESLR